MNHKGESFRNKIKNINISWNYPTYSKPTWINSIRIVLKKNSGPCSMEKTVVVYFLFRYSLTQTSPTAMHCETLGWELLGYSGCTKTIFLWVVVASHWLRTRRRKTTGIQYCWGAGTHCLISSFELEAERMSRQQEKDICLPNYCQ
jgi:hypothetical protein